MDEFLSQIKLLTGFDNGFPKPSYLPSTQNELFARGGVTYHQFNEFLLSLGYNRITKAFFNHFLCPRAKISPNPDPDKECPIRIKSFNNFKDFVRQFRKFAMLKYGNFQFTFTKLSNMSSQEIQSEIEDYQPISEEGFKKRPAPLIDPIVINSEDTYLLGYISGKNVKELSSKEKPEQRLTAKEKEIIKLRGQIVLAGIRNYEKYLADDYIDVYVATSMRRREDFLAVYDFVKSVFNNPEVNELNLRYFDPTQADPQDRFAKGLLEGLMVKRARCTIYCAQESDTFGKDSELAATLAQGKPVITYVPKIADLDEYKKQLLKMLKVCADGNDREYAREILFERHPRCVLEKPEIAGHQVTVEKILDEIALRDQQLYDSRADTLHENHPLSLQINLQTGVANGVIVVRSAEECASILRGVILRELEFDIKTEKAEGRDVESSVLKERRTGSVFRVVTGDRLLTNSFWNFYLSKLSN